MRKFQKYKCIFTSATIFYCLILKCGYTIRLHDSLSKRSRNLYYGDQCTYVKAQFAKYFENVMGQHS